MTDYKIITGIVHLISILQSSRPGRNRIADVFKADRLIADHYFEIARFSYSFAHIIHKS